LSQRRVDSRVAMLFITRSLVDIPIAHYIKLHQNGILIQPIIARTNYYQYLFFPHTISDWNVIPRDTLQEESLVIFKSKVATLTHDLPY
jgi:hypothetical protein